jgi:cysteine sulfinate desulfinase/cysteine desulfurase-like protein
MDRIDCSAHSRVSSTRRLRVLALVPSVSYGIAVAAVARADRSLTDAIVPRIDRRTAVVATSNCHWTDGSFIDLRRVGAAARTHGAALVVDASQSLGAYPFDVTGIQPDFLGIAKAVRTQRRGSTTPTRTKPEPRFGQGESRWASLAPTRPIASVT